MSVNHAKTDASNRKKQNNASTDLTKLMLIMMNGSSSENQPVHPIHYQNIPNLNLMARQQTPVTEERTNGTEYATSFHEYKKECRPQDGTRRIKLFGRSEIRRHLPAYRLLAVSNKILVAFQKMIASKKTAIRT